ncbi:calcium-translocating P-type ATPase, PMCA-type [Salibacterium lacus]|uniref:P-type Ca(2+) transporter n=1 Tax=Salibacterium lacus TaxID=1898109 RepID=A0ABW5T005_9BACI
MNWYNQSREELERILNVSAASGLTDEEAAARKKQHGANRLEEKKKTPQWKLFLQQFQDMMIILLIGAVLVSAMLGEYADVFTILGIVLLNGILGFVQENRAEKSLDTLKELSSPMITVQRSGSWITIPSEDAVPGDIVKLRSGDKISADIRLINVQGLTTEESALTGESQPVEKEAAALENKDLPVGERVNMAFSGTLVTKGRGEGVVVASGMKTEMGKIAHLLSESKTNETPLQQRLAHLGKILISGALILTALVVLLGIIQGQPFYKMILSGVSLAVAAIPEGLPAIVTVVLALGVQRMIKQNAIVRHLPAVETLGCASIICSDKTGTLTENKMTVTGIWNEYGLSVRKKRKDQFDRRRCENLLIQSVLASQHAVDTYLEGASSRGDATETALMEAAQELGISFPDLFSEYEVQRVFPFDSERKRMTMLVKDRQGRRFVISKGAPDVLLKKCTRLQKQNSAAPLSRGDMKEIKQMIETMASQSWRTIAVASRTLSSHERIETAADAEKELTFTGMAGMMDPPRPEAAAAVRECRKAGIKTVMITGDHKTTAAAVARSIGILPKYGKVMSGQEWNTTAPEKKRELLQRTYVFARVSPRDKLDIVQELQKAGHVVAMTGDGVNDAPALKAADIGVAMGRTGTDVAKEAAALVLRDDNFSTIRAAIREGRNIYDNIRKFIRYMLASNVGEILVMLFAVMLALPLPLVPIQILWINLITDGLPAMALGVDQPERDGMNRPPRSKSESIFADGMGKKIVSRGFLIGIVTLIGFMTALWEHPQDLVRAQTIAFSTLVMAQLIHVFDCRASSSIFDRRPFENTFLTMSVLSSVLLLLIVIYVPLFQPVFHTTPLTTMEWLLVLALASIPTFALAGGRSWKNDRN